MEAVPDPIQKPVGTGLEVGEGIFGLGRIGPGLCACLFLHILIPAPRLCILTWTSLICASYVAGMDSRSPIGVAGALLKANGKYPLGAR